MLEGANEALGQVARLTFPTWYGSYLEPESRPWVQLPATVATRPAPCFVLYRFQWVVPFNRFRVMSLVNLVPWFPCGLLPGKRFS